VRQGTLRSIVPFTWTARPAGVIALGDEVIPRWQAAEEQSVPVECGGGGGDAWHAPHARAGEPVLHDGAWTVPPAPSWQ
jgi:hypothetical protein